MRLILFFRPVELTIFFCCLPVEKVGAFPQPQPQPQPRTYKPPHITGDEYLNRQVKFLVKMEIGD